MKVKLGQIVDAMPAMAQFAQKELPAKAAYRVAKLVRKMNAEFQAFQQIRSAGIMRHGSKVEQTPEQMKKAGGPQYRLDKEQGEALEAELQKLLGEEVELVGCVPVAWADLEKLQLAPAVLVDLDPFIEAPPAELKQVA